VQSITTRLQSLHAADLTPLVRQILESSTADVVDWHIHRFGGGAGEYAANGTGAYRIAGSARISDGIRTWSVVLKIMRGTTVKDTDEPATGVVPREVLLYQSGMLTQLPSGVAAPHCYGITTHLDAEYWLWLEDLQPSALPWTPDAFGQVAQHFGQFNGAYLTGHPLPTQPWLSQGRVREWLTLVAPLVEQYQQLVNVPDTESWLTGTTIDHMLRLWSHRDLLLPVFERLPQCLCHHDAFRRNVFVCQRTHASQSTIAIDWELAGLGRVGEEAGMSTATNLFWLEVPALQARWLDEITFASYLAGLRQVGWNGDRRVARLGYTITAAMTTGVAFPFIVLDFLRTPEGATRIEPIFGHPLEALVGQWAQVHPFLLDLGSEAVRLANELQAEDNSAQLGH
jgi:hypothetical protein